PQNLLYKESQSRNNFSLRLSQSQQDQAYFFLTRLVWLEYQFLYLIFQSFTFFLKLFIHRRFMTVKDENTNNQHLSSFTGCSVHLNHSFPGLIRTTL
ncbi:hypothetical protein AALD19_17805, partial [Bacteroides acidifaciens]|uniref:hypothetical protein n=1 Tax=Bacteroides acidifaciens TaxID=85831 RepID=UPI0035145A59